MKALILSLGLLAASLSVTFAQRVKQQISDQACTCIERITPGKAVEVEQEISDCIQEALVNNMKALANEAGVKESAFNGEKGQEVGQEIGVMLATDCREFRNLMRQVRAEKEEKARLEAAKVTQLRGKLKRIKGKPFTYVIFKDNFKRTHELLLLKEFEGVSELLNNFKKLKKRKVTLVWQTTRVYNGSEGEFVEVKELIGMK